MTFIKATGLAVIVAMGSGVGLASGASAQGNNASQAIKQQHTEKSFAKCAASPQEKSPTASTSGAVYGPGITEVLTTSIKNRVNTGLKQTGRAPLPANVVALRYLNTDSVVALDASGVKVQRIDDSHDDHSGGPNRPSATTFSVGDEIKRVVGACLGVGTTGGNTWAALGENVLRELTSWQTAVKFVVRRIGVVAAVSCMGGIVWEYI